MNKPNEEVNKKKSNLKDGIKLLFLVGFFTLLLLTLKIGINNLSESAVSCLNNPFIYGSKEISRQNNDEASCYCSVGSKTFTFNSTSFNDRSIINGE